MRITKIGGGLSPVSGVCTPKQAEALLNVLKEQGISEHLNVEVIEPGTVLIEDEVPSNVYTQNYRFAESIARVIADPVVATMGVAGVFAVSTSSSAGDEKFHIVTVEDNVVRFHRTEDDPGTVVELTVASS